ncbi:MAG: hypothetical protein U9Q73_01895 [Nanoarchaeota archaeon]|nr:hypothetical protein [Nanoarchaeota archaeon]
MPDIEDEEKKERELRVLLKNKYFAKLEIIKDFLGIENNADIIRYLITKESRDIEKTS